MKGIDKNSMSIEIWYPACPMHKKSKRIRENQLRQKVGRELNRKSRKIVNLGGGEYYQGLCTVVAETSPRCLQHLRYVVVHVRVRVWCKRWTNSWYRVTIRDLSIIWGRRGQHRTEKIGLKIAQVSRQLINIHRLKPVQLVLRRFQTFRRQKMGS
jgi:hypothetical protein